MLEFWNDATMRLPAPTQQRKVESHHSIIPSFHHFAASGFTLVEVIVALSVAMLVIGVAALSITAVNDENKLRRSASQIELTAREALLEAVSAYHPVFLALDGSLALSEDSEPGVVEVRRYGEKAFRQARKGEVWEFSPTGVCEPIEIRIMNRTGTIELGFDPLTGCARKKNITVNG